MLEISAGHVTLPFFQKCGVFMKSIFAVVLMFCSLSNAFTADTSAIDTAIANASRPADDKKADDRRHPRELLIFSQIKSGDSVVDVLPGKVRLPQKSRPLVT
jgi:predicted methyltransferase